MFHNCALGYCDEWKLMAAGTAHGLVVFDCLQNIVVNTKCTLNAQGSYDSRYKKIGRPCLNI